MGSIKLNIGGGCHHQYIFPMKIIRFNGGESNRIAMLTGVIFQDVTGITSDWSSFITLHHLILLHQYIYNTKRLSILNHLKIDAVLSRPHLNNCLSRIVYLGYRWLLVKRSGTIEELLLSVIVDILVGKEQVLGWVYGLRHDINSTDKGVSFLGVEGVEGVIVLDECGLHLTVGLLLRSELLLMEKLKHFIHGQANVDHSYAETQNGLPREAVSNL